MYLKSFSKSDFLERSIILTLSIITFFITSLFLLLLLLLLFPLLGRRDRDSRLAASFRIRGRRSTRLVQLVYVRMGAVLEKLASQNRRLIKALCCITFLLLFLFLALSCSVVDLWIISDDHIIGLSLTHLFFS